MRAIIVIVMSIVLFAWAASSQALEKTTDETQATGGRSIKELPKDLMSMAFVWTGPVKEIAKRSIQSDPITGLWRGLFIGSIKTVEQTASFFLSRATTDSDEPHGGLLLRYKF